MSKDHIHEVGDGRGPRIVYVDGKRVESAFYANTKHGIVHAYKEPISIQPGAAFPDYYVIRGNVEVSTRNERH
jgi:hypothetical protein